MIYVSKFGGTSVADGKQFSKVKEIIAENCLRKIVIVSALGRRHKNDSKITDLLYLLSAHLKYKVNYRLIWDEICQRYIAIKDELGLKIDLQKIFIEIESHFKDNVEEYIVSRGEYLCALLMSEYLGYHFVDASEVIKFRYSGEVDDKETVKNIQNALKTFGTLVIPGFYGAYPNGDIKLFSRGGSDITGSIVAQAVNATKYENWTDVSGILMADPKIIDNPKRIKEITYDELRELSYMGASVLHEETIFPIQELNIPIHILNTNAKDDEGTIICQDTQDNTNIITGIAGKKGFKSITVTKQRGASKLHTIQEALSVLDKYHVNVEHLPTSIDSFSVIVESETFNKYQYDIISEIKQLDDIIEVEVDDDISLVAVVGRNMVTKPGISGKIFAIFGDAKINIKMIAQGSQEINIIVGIATKDFEKSIHAIYEKMVL